MKIPFPTTPEQVRRIPELAQCMISITGLNWFTAQCVILAETDQGVYDLMDLFFEYVRGGVIPEAFRVLGDLEQALIDYGVL